jgi:hypothetical protein
MKTNEFFFVSTTARQWLTIWIKLIQFTTSDLITLNAYLNIIIPSTPSSLKWIVLLMTSSHKAHLVWVIIHWLYNNISNWTTCMCVILTFDLRHLHNPIPVLSMLLPKSDIPERGGVCSQPRSGCTTRENNVLVYVCVCVCVCVCVYVWACACAHACTGVHSAYSLG